jgi:hypothetical protein
MLDCLMPSGFKILYRFFPVVLDQMLPVGYKVAMLHAVASITLAMYIRFIPSQRYAYP